MFRDKQKKRDKKSTVSLLRRFLNGEDITTEVMPLSYSVACLSTDELNKLRILHDYKEKYGIDLIEPGWTFKSDGKIVSYEDCVTIEAKIKAPVVMIPASSLRPSWATDGEQIAWNETKTHQVIIEEEEDIYPDPEIPGVSYQNPANVPKIDDIPERTNSSKKTERPETAAIKPIKRTEKPKPSQAEIDEQQRQARVEENRLQQEKILSIRETFNWQDVPFSGWLNQLGRR